MGAIIYRVDLAEVASQALTQGQLDRSHRGHQNQRFGSSPAHLDTDR